MTNNDLQYYYFKLNHRFFENKLPAIRVKFGTLPGTVIGRSYFLKGWKPGKIVISKKLKPNFLNRTAVTTLLHEMVHCKLGKPNCPKRFLGKVGKEWKSEIRRLASIGALDGII